MSRKREPVKMSGLLKSGAVRPIALADEEADDFVAVLPEADDRSAGEAEPVLQTEPAVLAGAIEPATETQVYVEAAESSNDAPVRVAAEQLSPSPVEARRPVPPEGWDLREIPIELIDANPLAPREVYTPQMILERADDLRTQGQHDPIHVIPHPQVEGRYVISDGWTRVQACRDHKVRDTLLAQVHYELSLEQAAWFGFEQNEGRTQHCDLDRAAFFERMIAAGESAAEIARRAKVSKQQLTMYRSYGKLPPDVLDIVRERPEKFTCNAVNELRKLFEKRGTRRTVALAVKFATEDQTVRWLVNQVQAGMNPAAPKGKAPSKQVRYGNGYYKQKGEVFEVSIAVSEAQRADFAAALEALLDTVAIQARLDVPEPDSRAESDA